MNTKNIEQSKYRQIRQKHELMRQQQNDLRQTSQKLRQMRQEIREIQQNSLLKLRKEGEKLQKLVASTQTLMYKERSLLSPVLECGDLRFNPATFEATYAAQALDLTAKECQLLHLFLQNNYRVLSRDEILKSLWQSENAPQAETVKAHIKHLRQKLQAAGADPKLIETVYGVGYRLKPNAQN